MYVTFHGQSNGLRVSVVNLLTSPDSARPPARVCTQAVGRRVWAGSLVPWVRVVAESQKGPRRGDACQQGALPLTVGLSR